MATLTTFTAGTPILSAEVNANFAALNTEAANLARGGYVSTTPVGTVGAGEDTLATWSMPANTGVVNGGIHVSALAFFAANGNTKTLRFYVGGSAAINMNALTAAPNSRTAVIDFRLWYASSTTATVGGSVLFSDHTIQEVITGSIFALDWTNAMTLRFTGEGTADNDVQLFNVAMLAFRQPS